MKNKTDWRYKLYELTDITETSENGKIHFDFYDIFMLIIILISLIPLLFKEETQLMIKADILTAFVFIVDYILRWITADYRFRNKSIISFVRYPFSFMAVADLLSIIPSLAI